MKKLNVQLILVGTRGEHHACGGRCTGRPRKDGFCYHEGDTRHRIGQCHEHAPGGGSGIRKGASPA
jgi:hypothetical protein